MTLVAIHAAVYIATHVPVIRVRIRLGVAVRALEDAVVSRIGVTGRAHSVGTAMLHGKPGVIKRRTQPTRCRMTDRASCWETGRHVIRIVGSLIVHFVTAEAVGRQGRVVVVHVTVRAEYRGVLSGQGKARVVVIEDCRAPSSRVVAHIALLGKADGSMIWVRRLLKITQVAADADSISDAVVAVRMALAALQS